MPKPKAPEPPAEQHGAAEIVQTRPLGEFKAIPESSAIESEPLVTEQEQEPAASDNQQESATSELNQEPAANAEFVPPPPPPPPPPPFEPLESFPPLSPAVNALALASNQDSASGNVEAATASIERAIRIEPRNATLYYKLALLKLKQSKPGLAEDLAKKAALLASDDAQLKKHSWLLVARAREMQGDMKGGKEARAKAGKF